MHAQVWYRNRISKRHGLGPMNDKEMIRFICAKTGWDRPAKNPRAKHEMFRKFWNTVDNKATSFYAGKRWQLLRYEVLRKRGARCECCGQSPRTDGISVHVDHIKPRSKYPELAFDESNLQVLCEDCNFGKSNRDETDWRPGQDNRMAGAKTQGLPQGI